MKILKMLVIAIIVGLIATAVFGQYTTSKYPSCDLVSKGITVSTYGCSNTASNNYPCANLAPKSADMSVCIQKNYYKLKTFPFGFKQNFGPQSNLVDQKPISENHIASFGLGFVVAFVVAGLMQLRNKPEPAV